MLSWNASSGLPEEHLLFEHLFHFHDVSMHLGGLNPLMRCNEQRKIRNLTARFKASTPLRLPHLHIPRRSVYQEGAVDGKNIDVSIQTLLESPQFGHGRRGNDMNYMLVLVFYRYVYSSLHSYHDPCLKIRARGRLFLVSMLGPTTLRDGF